jgi:pimeloyl-ACP methyl ester carboxylesterase
MATYVLIPGAGGSAWYFHRLVPHLRERGHDAVPVDLGALDDDAGLDRYAEAVVEAIGERPRPLVLVAQSFGGFTAPLVCERVAVDLLVLLNGMVPAPSEPADAWWDATGFQEAREAAAARDGRSPEFDLQVDFLHDVPEDVAAAAMGQPQRSETAAMGEPWPLERWPDVPTRFVQGRDDRFFPIEFQRRVAAERLGIEVDEIAGGHLAALSRPQELADRLVAYLRE